MLLLPDKHLFHLLLNIFRPFYKWKQFIAFQFDSNNIFVTRVCKVITDTLCKVKK